MEATTATEQTAAAAAAETVRTAQDVETLRRAAQTAWAGAQAPELWAECLREFRKYSYLRDVDLIARAVTYGANENGAADCIMLRGMFKGYTRAEKARIKTLRRRAAAWRLMAELLKQTPDVRTVVEARQALKI